MVALALALTAAGQVIPADNYPNHRPAAIGVRVAWRCNADSVSFLVSSTTRNAWVALGFGGMHARINIYA